MIKAFSDFSNFLAIIYLDNIVDKKTYQNVLKRPYQYINMTIFKRVRYGIPQ